MNQDPKSTEKAAEKKTSLEEEEAKRVAAKELETPERPVVPEVVAKREEATAETPEAPVAPPVERAAAEFQLVQPANLRSGGAGMTTYTNFNYTNDPATTVELDTGVGSAPVARPSVFTPSPRVVSTPANDFGVGSAKALRPTNSEPQQSATIYVNPGAF